MQDSDIETVEINGINMFEIDPELVMITDYLREVPYQSEGVSVEWALAACREAVRLIGHADEYPEWRSCVLTTPDEEDEEDAS